MMRLSPRPREPYELRGTKRNLVSEFKPGAKSNAESPTTDGLLSPSKKRKTSAVTPTTVAIVSSGKVSLTPAGKDNSSNNEKVNSAKKASATAALVEIAEGKAMLAAIGNAKEASAKTPGSAKKKKTPDSKKKKRKSPSSSSRKKQRRSLPMHTKKTSVV